jgi:hypothetical protein
MGAAALSKSIFRTASPFAAPANSGRGERARDIHTVKWAGLDGNQNGLLGDKFFAKPTITL